MSYQGKNERTLVILKPDALQRTLVGEIIKRYEQIGLKLIAVKMLVPTPEQVEQHYTLDPEWRRITGEKTIKGYKDKGAVLLGIATGSFGEGIDMPDVLKAVIIVGLPLNPPDVETNALIAYYNKKYSKGWDYAYIFPAITKCMQGAGRCIRSETDRGVVVFMDERFALSNYSRCFPPDYGMKITKNVGLEIKEFFG